MAIVALLMSIPACTSDPDAYRSDAGGDSRRCPDEAGRLAALDTGEQLPAESVVRQYQLALDALSNNCPETSEELGDRAVDAQSQLSEGGVDESLLDIRNDVNSRMPRGRLDSCQEPFLVHVLIGLGP
jgi:hypothetical protein